MQRERGKEEQRERRVHMYMYVCGYTCKAST